jgi:hypothetical protein
LSAAERGEGRRALGLGLGGLVAVLALAYLRVLFAGETFAVRDHLTWTVPSRAFLADSLRRGHLPEWWDGLRLGDRFAADPNNGVTYPLAWLVALVEPLFGADLVLLLHVLLAGAGTLLFARRLGAGRLGAFFGGAALMTSGYVASMVVNGSVLMALGWMPLVLWAALGVAQAEDRRAGFRQGLLCSLVLAGSAASGNPTGVYNILLAFLVVLVGARRRVRALVIFSAAGLLGGLMAAASVLVPLLTLQDSARAGGFTLAESGVWSMHPLRLVELLWPDLLGHGTRLDSYLADLWVESSGLGGTWAASVYVGFPVLCCAAVAAVADRGLPRRLAYVSLAFLLLALGTYTPLYGLYRAIFRFEQVLRYPEKLLASALVLWSALAGVGLDRLFARENRWPRLLRVCVGVAVLLAATCGAGALLRGRLAHAITQSGVAHGRAIDAQAVLSYSLAGGLSAAVAALLVAVAVGVAQHPRLGRFARPGFVILALAQLVAHDWSTQVLLPREVLRRPPALLAALPAPAPGEVPRLLRRAQDKALVAPSAEVHALYLYQLAVENAATRFGFGQVPGYAIAGTARFDAFARASGRSNLERIMDLLDVRYLVIDARQAGAMGMPSLTREPRLGHVVLENWERRPRAFVAYRYRHGLADEQVFSRLFAAERAGADFGAVDLAGPGVTATAAPDALTPCAVERPVPEHVILHCRATRAGYAVLLEEWTRGWSATVDGTPTPVERADVIFRAVPLAAGEHRIELRYRTPGLRTGAAIALFAWLAFLVLVGVWLRSCVSGSRPESRAPTPAPPG